MANLNRVFLMGNLTRDPQVRYLPSGTPVVELGLAINRSWMDQKSGERREETTFVDCKSIGRSAENIGRFFAKGKPIFVEGRLEFRSWEAKDGSGKRSKLEVFIENWQFVGGRGEEGGGGGGGRPPARGGRDQEREQGGYGGGPQDRDQDGFGGGGGGGPARGSDSYSDASADIGDDDVPF